jgi:hypothetical protein
MTLTARQLALRYRGESELAPSTRRDQDEAWFDHTLPRLLRRIGDDAPVPRWFFVFNGKVRLVRPSKDVV